MLLLCVLVGLLGLSDVLGIGLFGGKKHVDVSSTDVQEMANFAIADMNTKANGMSQNSLAEVLSADTQGVQGTNYYLQLRIGYTTGSSHHEKICDVTIWSKIWEKFTEVTSTECRQSAQPVHRRMASGCAGCVSDPVDVTSGDVQDAARFAETAMNQLTNGLAGQLVTVVSAQKQVVAGIKYILKVKMFYDKTKTCDVVVLHQAWEDPQYSLLNWDCDTGTKITTNEIPDTKPIPETKPLYYKPHLLGGDGHDYCHYGMFLDFQNKHQRNYASPRESTKRFHIFCDNMRKVKKLRDTEKGTAVYGATMFADMTESEFKQYVGKPWDLKAADWMTPAEIPLGDIPQAFDWRDHDAVTPVKNQGSCGSCWAFSTTGNIEGQWAIRKKHLISLSEQELVDCDKLDEGCGGGLPSNAYKEIIRLGGLETETDYKYEAHDEKCHFNKKEVEVYINSSVKLSTDEKDMAAWLAQNGPISIGINANVMQFYYGGISHPWKIFCNPDSLDHGVLIVGYGVQDSTPYWIVKNSWGESWGEKGYYLVYRGGGVCGLNKMPTSAVVK